MPNPTRPPTADELRNHPVVVAALEQAWVDSIPNDAARRHEEGGWIYLNKITGEIATQRALPGQQSEVNLSNPPIVEGSVVVGVFHTHPNPSSEGWDPGPSAEDLRMDDRDGVPDLIRADNGVYFSGPRSRRGGLTGSSGFPQ